MRKLLSIIFLVAISNSYAQSLSCQTFDFNSPEVQQARNAVFSQYAHRQPETLSETEAMELNHASLLSQKTVCTFSGSLKQAFATFRVNKPYGLGKLSPQFTRQLPRNRYQKVIDYKGINQNLAIVRQNKQVEMAWGIIDRESILSYRAILRQEGKQVRIEIYHLNS